MKYIRHAAILSGLLIAASFVLFQPEIATRAISKGILVCANSILPTLFPFFIISDLWCTLGYSQQVSKVLSPFMNAVFHLPGSAAPALITAAVGGYPVGIQTLTKLYENNAISKHHAEATLLFCNLAGPAFILGIVGVGLFQSLQIGVVLWVIHLASAFSIGFLFRPSASTPDTNVQYTATDTAFLPALTLAIKKAGETTVQVCIFILFFSIVTENLAHLLPSSVQSAVLLGSFELASGCTSLGNLGLPQKTVFVICSGFLGWGGLCVHFQSVSMLSRTDLSTKNHWAGKALQGLLSTALACLIAPYLPLHAPCFASASAPPVTAIAFLACLMILMLEKSSSRKTGRYRI